MSSAPTATKRGSYGVRNNMMHFPSQAQIKNLSNNNLKTLIFKIERKGLAHIPVADDTLALAKLELELRKENAVTSN